MDALEFLKERKRMCKLHPCCGGCPLEGTHCALSHAMDDEDYERVINTVEQWSKENPRKTRQSVFLEQWPEARIYANGALSICPNAVCAWRCGKDGERVEETGTCDDCCREFWMQEVE